MIHEYFTLKLLKAFQHTKIREIKVFQEDDYYRVYFKFLDTSSVKFLVDLEGLWLLTNKVKRLSFNKKYNAVIVSTEVYGKINFNKYIAIHIGYQIDSINRIEFVNNDRLDFRVCNLHIVNTIKRVDMIFHDTSKMVEIAFIPKPSIVGFDRGVYRIDDKTILIEFKNASNTIQSILDDEFSIYDYSKMFVYYNDKQSEWRLCYGDGVYKIPITRHIMSYTGKLFIDHINRLTMDNRKVNLRIATRSVNGHNRSKQNKNSNYIKGVFESDHRDNGKPRYIVAYITINGEKLQRNFSIKRNGLLNAIQMATTQRREWNKKFKVEEE